MYRIDLFKEIYGFANEVVKIKIFDNKEVFLSSKEQELRIDNFEFFNNEFEFNLNTTWQLHDSCFGIFSNYLEGKLF